MKKVEQPDTKGSMRLMRIKTVCKGVVVCNSVLPLTYVKDEGVAESVVSIVTSVDQELCVREHSAAVPAGTHTKTHKILKT